jgi:serine protease AprX
MARRALFLLALLVVLAGQAQAADHPGDAKLDSVLQHRAHAPAGTSQVIVRTVDGQPATLRIRAAGGLPIRSLGSVGGQVARVPDTVLHKLAALPEVASISLDRPVVGTVERTAATIGARWVAEHLGVDGKGIGIALIDSGVSPWLDGIDYARIVHFADFVNQRTTLYDDYGHGTHVAGIVAGRGDADGARRGLAPAADLIVLKALDGAGGGYISSVIAAIDYAIAHRETYNIRVINLSVSAGVYESYLDDPLTLAARRAVDAGIVVVAAAGNFGRNTLAEPQSGGIAAPGNAPWVLTVGASTHNGTIDRADDEVADFSSRGPAAIDRTPKPDLVAPGVSIESLAEPSSGLFASHAGARRWSATDAVSPSLLSLSGTSMAAPVAAATVALMLQVNPSLTPNAVKAILQFTAETRAGYDHLSQGAGFLNARGAIELAGRFRLDQAARAAIGDPVRWSRRLIWGDRPVPGGMLTPDANAWQPGVVWGASTTPTGDAVVLGTVCAAAQPSCSETSPWTIACEPGSPGCPRAGRPGSAGIESRDAAQPGGAGRLQ